MVALAVTMSIVLAISGWLISVALSKTAWEAWEKYLKSIDLDKEIKNLIQELKLIELPENAAELARLPKGYMKEVKELVYEAKDLLDELDYFRLQEEVKQMNKVEHGAAYSKPKLPRVSFHHSSSTEVSTKKLKLDKEGMSKRSKCLIEKLEYVKPALLNQQLGSIIAQVMKTVTNQTVPENRPKTTTQTRETFYGRDAEMKQILELIDQDLSKEKQIKDQYTQKIPVVTIVGNGGLGKTALAQHVCKGTESYFNLIIWICISKFDEMDIIREMLEHCPPHKSYQKHQSKNALKKILKDHLKEKNVLLVMDDIWEMNNGLDDVLTPFDTEKANMVLVTTRDPSIAKTIGTTHDILWKDIYLDGMDPDNFWSLFKSGAFGDDPQKPPPLLEKIGKKIAKRLKGYSLAAKAVGPLLKDNTDVGDWMNILKTEEWKSMGGTHGIMPALRLSYEHLPIHLQPCFSYCSLLPKGYYFKAEDLVYMWMAQGFIHIKEDDSRRIEDVGHDYLNCLVEKGLIQPIAKWNGLEYVIHDLMHDCAQLVSKGECLSIEHPQSITVLPAGLRHLSIVHHDKGLDQIMANSVEFQNLRSLIINERYYAGPCHYLQCGKAKNVRLLILPHSWPKQSTSFIHLRYLRLSLEYTGHIPTEICRLYHLEVLELTDNYHEDMTVPTDFNNLVKLRHFIASSKFHSKIAGVGRLNHLQELKSFGVRNEKGFELEQLAELKELRGSLQIFGLKNAKRCKTFKLSDNISCLTLSWWGELCGAKLPIDDELEMYGTKSEDTLERTDTLESTDTLERTDTLEPKDTLEILQANSNLKELNIWCYEGCESPSWLANYSLKYLKFLCLYHCDAWKVLPNFGQLECLEELHLSFLPKVEKFDLQFHGCHPQGGFPSLKVMTVSDMAKLKTWECAVFPSLENLTIERCPELSNFTISVDGEGQKRFPRLCDFVIENCPKLHQVSSTAGTQIVFETDNNIKDPLVRYNINDQIIELMVYGLQMITALDQVFLFKNFRNIELMEVRGCDNLESLLSNDTCLQELTIWNCNKLLVSPQVEVNLLPQVAIQKLTISDCGISRDGLSYLLKHIPFLCELTLDKCQNLLVSSEVNRRSFHVHKCLQKLTITECRVRGDIITSLLKCLPSLCQLSIISCPSVGSVSIPSGINEGKSSISHTTLLEEVEVDQGHQQCTDSLMHLQELYIRDCPNMEFINNGGLSGLAALKNVAIHGSEKLLSSINCFPKNLEELSVGDVPYKMNWSLTDLKYVHTLHVGKSRITLLKLHCFVALKKLELRDCIDLAVVRGLQSLDCLEEVIIYNCPHLTSIYYQRSRGLIKQEFSMPTDKLHIDNIEFLSVHANIVSMSLRSLTITVEYLWDARLMRFGNYWTEWTEEQEYALQHLTALKELTLYRCPSLCSLPGTYYRHPSLKKLTIINYLKIKSLRQKDLPQSLEKLLLGRDCSEKLTSQCSKLENFECTNDPSHQDFFVFVKKGSSVTNGALEEIDHYRLDPAARRAIWGLIILCLFVYYLFM